ncbi:hypothetical protein BDV36DRAFT_123047 [Aspergillus pseudocaelatus]|uniref:Secreted protein n=1 Tax=Aspergillus pseudocaelatus TaxID=1825620 RepID=A0ABQ6W2T1_9EURO|nr:hypothetical protein BDV36DRAFT_123047 [Aspergillus pseudocaelatus]
MLVSMTLTSVLVWHLSSCNNAGHFPLVQSHFNSSLALYLSLSSMSRIGVEEIQIITNFDWLIWEGLRTKCRIMMSSPGFISAECHSYKSRHWRRSKEYFRTPIIAHSMRHRNQLHVP